MSDTPVWKIAFDAFNETGSKNESIQDAWQRVSDKVIGAALKAGDPACPVVAYVPGEWTKVQTVDEMQAFFLSRLPAIREVAREHGYAIGTHGSQLRDFDLMAMQWRDDASDKETLAHAIAMAACGITRDGPYLWEIKPTGRFAVSIPICWTSGNRPSEGMIDLSVIDAQAAIAQRDATIAELRERLEGAERDARWAKEAKELLREPNIKPLVDCFLSMIDAAMKEKT